MRGCTCELCRVSVYFVLKQSICSSSLLQASVFSTCGWLCCADFQRQCVHAHVIRRRGAVRVSLHAASRSTRTSVWAVVQREEYAYILAQSRLQSAVENLEHVLAAVAVNNGPRIAAEDGGMRTFMR
jgi:hypothetical protein